MFVRFEHLWSRSPWEECRCFAHPVIGAARSAVGIPTDQFSPEIVKLPNLPVSYVAELEAWSSLGTKIFLTALHHVFCGTLCSSTRHWTTSGSYFRVVLCLAAGYILSIVLNWIGPGVCGRHGRQNVEMSQCDETVEEAH